MQLAKRGLNIILISRTLSKLETVAKEIQETFGVQTVVIDVDFTSGPEIYDKIKEKVKGKEIGILVNNVGMCYDTPDYFLSIPNREKFSQDMIKCNILSMPMMCSIIMPQMVQRKRGLVINLASIAAVLPGSMMTIYAATKAFVNKFSEDLAAEYLYQGITVQSILPGPVSTKMLIIDDILWLTPTAEKYVESALKTVGFASEANGYFAHSLIQYFSQLINYISPWLAHTISMQSLKAIHNQQIKKGFNYESGKN